MGQKRVRDIGIQREREGEGHKVKEANNQIYRHTHKAKK